MKAKAQITVLIIFAIVLGIGGGVLLANSPEEVEEIVKPEEESEQALVDISKNEALYIEPDGNKEDYLLKDLGTTEPNVTPIADESGKVYGEVKLDSYGVIEDAHGSGRKAMVFWITETNMSNRPIAVGGDTAGIARPTVFYNDTQLKPLSYSSPIPNLWDEDYIENKHVQYGTGNDRMAESCRVIPRDGVLQPGESRTCYYHYSYAGPGTYEMMIPIEGDNNFDVFHALVLESDELLETYDPSYEWELGIGRSLNIRDREGERLKIKSMGYEIVEDTNDPSKQGIVFFFDRINISDEGLGVGSGNDEDYERGVDIAPKALASFEGKPLEQITSNTSEEKRMASPNYKNVSSCDNYTVITSLMGEVCYQIYPYEGEGEYSISFETLVNQDAYTSFVVNVPEDKQLKSGHTEKYNKEESIFSYSDYERSEFESTPHLPQGNTVQIIEDDEQIGTVSLPRYEVFEDSNGHKGVAFFFTETNTGTEPLDLGMYNLNQLTKTHVFYGDTYLDEMNYNAPLGQSVEYPDYPHTKLCLAATTLQPGESRTCYQYYSYVGDGEYLINIGTKRDKETLEFSEYKSYLINVEE